MHIVTVMDYEDENYINMCKMWIYFAKRFNPEANITIFHHEHISDIKLFATSFKKIRFIRLNAQGVIKFRGDEENLYPGCSLKLALWKHISEHRMGKHIFVDADAFIIESLADWRKIIDEKPFIAIEEMIYDGYKIFNCGVYSFSGKSIIFTYPKLIDQYHRDGDRVLLPVGEQGLINSYLKRLNYDCAHHKIGFEYNCLAKYCKIEKVDDTEIIVYSGDLPKAYKFYIVNLKMKNELWHSWNWWGMHKKVKILHSMGPEKLKFWNLPECQKIWNYGLDKIEEIEKRQG